MPHFKNKDDYQNEVVEIASHLDQQERQKLFNNFRPNQMTMKQFGIYEALREVARERSSQNG